MRKACVLTITFHVARIIIYYFFKGLSFLSANRAKATNKDTIMVMRNENLKMLKYLLLMYKNVLLNPHSLIIYMFH